MGESHFVKGCCPLDCQDTCAWVAEVDDGRVTAVRGAKDHPFTRGVLCAKVNDYPARTYSTRPAAASAAQGGSERLRSIRAHLVGCGARSCRRPLLRNSGRARTRGAVAAPLSRLDGSSAVSQPDAAVPRAWREPDQWRHLQCRGERRRERRPAAGLRSRGHGGQSPDPPLGHQYSFDLPSSLAFHPGGATAAWRAGCLPRPDPHADGPAMRRAYGAPPRHRYGARSRHGPRDARGGTCRPRLRAGGLCRP